MSRRLRAIVVAALATLTLGCGVGASAKFIRKQAMNITKLMSVSAPDGFVAGLADLHLQRPELGINRAHLYPFGGFDRLFDWLDEARS